MDFEYYYESNLPLLKFEKVKIRITMRTLEKAKKNDAVSCPIARAIRKKIKWGDVVTTNDEIYFYHSKFNRKDTESVLGRDKIAKISMDDSLLKFLKDFDNDMDIKLPVILEVNVPKVLLIP
jgi:hypothetical protein